MKYRRNKVKREHSIIEDALEWLEELSANPEVEDIIPGVIEVAHTPEKGIVYKYETQTGCKLLVKSNGSIQEVFVVTKDPQFVEMWVQKHFPAPDKGSEKRDYKAKTPAKENKHADRDQQPFGDQDRFEDDEQEFEEQWMRDVVRIRRSLPRAKKRVRRGIYEYDEKGFVIIDENLRKQVLQKWAPDGSSEVKLTELVNPQVFDALAQLREDLERRQTSKHGRRKTKNN